MTTKMIIAVPAAEVRSGWKKLADTQLSADVVLEIVQRYFDAQEHARNYRQRAASKAKLLKEFALAAGFGQDSESTSAPSKPEE